MKTNPKIILCKNEAGSNIADKAEDRHDGEQGVLEENTKPGQGRMRMTRMKMKVNSRSK